MDVWAIIKTGGKQYKVAQGDAVLVEKINAKADRIVFDQVLAIGSNNQIKIGRPNVAGAKVRAKILENFKDKKIRVVKFKSKSRYLRTRGHRQPRTRLLIEKIES